MTSLELALMGKMDLTKGDQLSAPNADTYLASEIDNEDEDDDDEQEEEDYKEN